MTCGMTLMHNPKNIKKRVVHKEQRVIFFSLHAQDRGRGCRGCAKPHRDT